jgi:peptidoglycan lytic transglycosylase B
MIATACTQTVAEVQVSSSPPSRNINTPVAATFEAWRDGFRAHALSSGISGAVFDSAFQGVSPNPEVIRLDAFQPEFTKPIWEYLDGAVSTQRISSGRSAYAKMQQTFNRIEATYGVDAEVVAAIWGMETNYGSFRGNMSVIECLATLAYDSRRRDFGEEQLIAALKILQAGDVTPERMVGSWAGAMGHTQFIPTSYLSYAQDFTGDGRRDIWSNDPTDALASTANYLRKFGWTKGQPWGVEVRLPDGFNFRNVDENLRRPVARWGELGVRMLDGSAIPNHGDAALIAPAGASGPVFAVFNNFHVIKKYNNATSYAIAVGHLGDRIMGAGPFRAKWPRSDASLSRTQKQELQQRLTARGFDTDGTDGHIGPKTISAIKAYQQAKGLTPDGYATASLLRDLR